MSERDFLAALGFMMLKKAANEAAETVSNEWREKQDDWQDRQQENLGRWVESFNRNAEKIHAIEQNMLKLDAMIADARNEIHRTMVQGWKADQNCRRLELQGKNSALHNKIESVKSKLSNSHSQTPWFYREGNSTRNSFRSVSRTTNSTVAGIVQSRNNGPFGGQTLTFNINQPKKKR